MEQALRGIADARIYIGSKEFELSIHVQCAANCIDEFTKVDVMF